MFAAYTLIFSDDSLIFFIFTFAQCKWSPKIITAQTELSFSYVEFKVRLKK